MRYVINDDDLEDWYSRLYQITTVISAGENKAHEEIDYILSQIEVEFQQHVPDENMVNFLALLRNRYV